MLSAAGDRECEAGLAQTAAPATCTASGSQRVAWSSSRESQEWSAASCHARQRAPRFSPEVGGSAKWRAGSDSSSRK